MRVNALKHFLHSCFVPGGSGSGHSCSILAFSVVVRSSAFISVSSVPAGKKAIKQV